MLARCPRGSHVGHIDLCLLCSQIWLPPKSLHRDLLLLCSQIWLPPQSLKSNFILLCPQTQLPPQKRHPFFVLLCSQIWLSPQSLQYDLCLPCLHLVCWFNFLQLSKHFTQHFVNCPVLLLFLKHSNNKKCLHFVHCFFCISINHQAHEKYHLVVK